MSSLTHESSQKKSYKTPRAWVWGKPWSHWRTARLVLLFLWMTLLVVASLWRYAFLKTPVELLSSTVFLVLLWPWVRGPYLLYKRGRFPLNARYEQIFDQGSYEGAIWTDHVLTDMGFERAGILVKREHVKTEVTISVNPVTGDSAQVGRIFRRRGVLYLLVFKTRFEDGFALETSNMHSAPLFAADPQVAVFRFPQLRFVSDLYRLHQKLKERFSALHVPCAPEPSEELRAFILRAEVVHQRIVKQDYKLYAARDGYVFTVKGAIRRAWLRTWPIDQIRRLRMEAKAMKMAEELGFRINPKAGCLVDTLQERILAAKEKRIR